MTTNEIIALRFAILIVLVIMIISVIAWMVRGFRGIEDEDEGEDDELEEPDTKPAPKPAPKIQKIVEPQQPQVRTPEKEPPAPEKQCSLSDEKIEELLLSSLSETQKSDDSDDSEGKDEEAGEAGEVGDTKKADDMASLEARVAKFASAQIAESMKGGDAK